jgi:hypothetical protein
MIQKFLDGKKKYSAFIITILATLIPLFIQEPGAQTELMDMVPSLAAVLAGIFYIVTQAGIDKEKEKAATAQAQAALVMANGAINGAQAQPAQPQQEIQGSPGASAPGAVEIKPLDIKLFHERVLNDTAAKYSEQNPATVFSEAKDKGSVTTCHNIKQAVDYWDYLVTLAYDAEQFVKEQTGIDKPGPCKVRSPEYVQMQLELMKTIRCRDTVYTLAQTNIDWRKAIAPNDTLYHVGVLAEELLKNM